MGLLSIFKRRADASGRGAAAAGDTGDAVQRARTRARQRLIGAVVLVGIGIIGFPLVFETQPRPIPVDIPIEIPRKEGAPALVMPAGRAPAAAAAASRSSAATVAEPVPAAPNDVITETREEAGREVPAPASAAAPARVARTASAPPGKPVNIATADAAATKPAAQPKPAEPRPRVDGKPDARPAATDGDAGRARALLDAKPASAADSARFVVQVGAFADAGAAHDTRLKAEKLGLKTYTQVASTPAGERIRVRVGPFSSRDDADKALAKARSAGLTAVVLTL